MATIGAAFRGAHQSRDGKGAVFDVPTLPLQQPRIPGEPERVGPRSEALALR